MASGLGAGHRLSGRGGTRTPNLLIRRYLYRRSDQFRTVRHLGRAAACCSRQSGFPQGRSSVWLPAWLPAAHDTGHRDALVLVTHIGPPTGEGTAACPAQTPPLNPTAAGPGDGRVLSSPSSRVHEPCTLTGAVALRLQRGLTGSGSYRYSYGGFGGGHSHFHPHTDCRQLNLTAHPRLSETSEGCSRGLLPAWFPENLAATARPVVKRSDGAFTSRTPLGADFHQLQDVRIVRVLGQELRYGRTYDLSARRALQERQRHHNFTFHRGEYDVDLLGLRLSLEACRVLSPLSATLYQLQSSATLGGNA